MRFERRGWACLLSTALALGALACEDGAAGGADGALSCEQAVAKMAACYPEVRDAAACSAETLAAFERNGLDGDCAAVYRAGKADTFAFAGCDVGQHVCGLVFCCDDEYAITWFPSEADWDIVPVVEAFQAAAPDEVVALRDDATRDALVEGVSATYAQSVAETLGGPAKSAAVEYASALVEVPFEVFVATLAPADWGVSLAHYLGGEVQVYERDATGRPVRQLERMVLSPFPCDAEAPVTNMDMTKVEVVEYGPDAAVVSWRVMASDNDSTEMDVGSVRFERYDGTATRVTFHSAHRLNTVLGLHIPNPAVRLILGGYFLGHIAHYAELVE